jgi:hypothetical protein
MYSGDETHGDEVTSGVPPLEDARRRRFLASLSERVAPVQAIRQEPNIGKAFAPLVALIGEHNCGAFMFMGIVQQVTGAAGPLDVFMYKHRDTRKYLNVSTDGRTWRYKGEDFDSYEPARVGLAVASAFNPEA